MSLQQSVARPRRTQLPNLAEIAVPAAPNHELALGACRSSNGTPGNGPGAQINQTQRFQNGTPCLFHKKRNPFHFKRYCSCSVLTPPTRAIDPRGANPVLQHRATRLFFITLSSLCFPLRTASDTTHGSRGSGPRRNPTRARQLDLQRHVAASDKSASNDGGACACMNRGFRCGLACLHALCSLVHTRARARSLSI